MRFVSTHCKKLPFVLHPTSLWWLPTKKDPSSSALIEIPPPISDGARKSAGELERQSAPIQKCRGAPSSPIQSGGSPPSSMPFLSLSFKLAPAAAAQWPPSHFLIIPLTSLPFFFWKSEVLLGHSHILRSRKLLKFILFSPTPPHFPSSPCVNAWKNPTSTCHRNSDVENRNLELLLFHIFLELKGIFFSSSFVWTPSPIRAIRKGEEERAASYLKWSWQQEVRKKERKKEKKRVRSMHTTTF